MLRHVAKAAKAARAVHTSRVLLHSMSPIEQHLADKLTSALSATDVHVTDISGVCLDEGLNDWACHGRIVTPFCVLHFKVAVGQVMRCTSLRRPSKVHFPYLPKVSCSCGPSPICSLPLKRFGQYRGHAFSSGKRVLQQHRMVTDALKEDMKVCHIYRTWFPLGRPLLPSLLNLFWRRTGHARLEDTYVNPMTQGGLPAALHCRVQHIAIPLSRQRPESQCKNMFNFIKVVLQPVAVCRGLP